MLSQSDIHVIVVNKVLIVFVIDRNLPRQTWCVFLVIGNRGFESVIGPHK